MTQIRPIQFQGGSYALYLPAFWIHDQQLRKGDLVSVKLGKDNELILKKFVEV